MAEKNFIRGIPENLTTKFAAQLRKAKDALNYVHPDAGARGSMRPTDPGKGMMGDLVFGEGPETLEQWGYGFPPWEGKGQTLGIKPEALDMVGMPLLGAGVATKLGANALRRGAQSGIMKAMPKPKPDTPDLSRREFLKKGGAAAAVTTAAAMTPDILRAGAKALKPSKAAVGVKAVRASAKDVLKKLTPTYVNRLKQQTEMWKKAWEVRPNSYSKQLNQISHRETALNALGDDFDITNTYTRTQLNNIDDFFKRLPDDVDPEVAFQRVIGDPIDSADMGDLGRLADNTSMFEEGPIKKKLRAAEDALDDMPSTDYDLWLATGKVPDSYPDDLVPYLQKDYFFDKSGKISGWDHDSGAFFSPDTMLDSYLNGKAAQLSHADAGYLKQATMSEAEEFKSVVNESEYMKSLK